ncbi:MAG: hypothetical protein LKG19_05730 [Saprospiraceae bacterium]|jgi:hypothetical protein|nr:hypothetical protein [Saprospiraceae bacterium]
MSTIIIKSDKQSSKILAELAIKLGENVVDINDSQFEDIKLGILMDNEKTGKQSQEISFLKN